jgi:hypothetical protein
MTCPKCGSSDVVHKDHRRKELNHSALHHGAHQLHGAVSGHPVGLLILAGCWAFGQFTHLIDKPWRCKKCYHEFS